MSKFIRWVCLIGLFVVTVVAILWVFVRVRGPNAAQRQALATMTRPPLAVQHNAFPALWLMPYDIPDSEMAAVFEQDRKAIVQAMARGDAIPVSKAEGRYARAMMNDAGDTICRDAATCLADVQADPAAAAAFVDRHAALIRRVEALAAYDGIRSEFGYRSYSPLPPYQLTRVPAAAYALAFVQGRRTEAFDGTCRAITTWRRLGSRSDHLVGRLLGSAFVSKRYGMLFMQMLARVPRGEALPASCDTAFAGTMPEENTLCPAFRGEFESMRDALLNAPNDPTLSTQTHAPRWLMPVLYSASLSEGDGAMMYAPTCSADADHRIAADEISPAGREVPSLARVECVGNIAGCLIDQIAAPEYETWFTRVQDSNASLRLIAEILAYRAEVAPKDSLRERLDALHARIGSQQRTIDIDLAGKRVRMSSLLRKPGDAWEAPLPPSLLGEPQPQ